MKIINHICMRLVLLIIALAIQPTKIRTTRAICTARGAGIDLSECNLTGATLTGVTSGGITGTPVLPTGWKLMNGYLVGPTTNLTNTTRTDVGAGGTSGNRTAQPIGYDDPTQWGTTANSMASVGNNTINQGAKLIDQPQAGSFIKIATGIMDSGSTCALTSSGAAYCWGYNANGQLGNGRNSVHFGQKSVHFVMGQNV